MFIILYHSLSLTISLSLSYALYKPPHTGSSIASLTNTIDPAAQCVTQHYTAYYKRLCEEAVPGGQLQGCVMSPLSKGLVWWCVCVWRHVVWLFDCLNVIIFLSFFLSRSFSLTLCHSHPLRSYSHPLSLSLSHYLSRFHWSRQWELHRRQGVQSTLFDDRRLRHGGVRVGLNSNRRTKNRENQGMRAYER